MTDSFAAWDLSTTITPGSTGYGPQARNLAPDAATVDDGYYDSEKLGADYGGSGTSLTTSDMQGTAARTNMDDLIESSAWVIVGTDPVNGGYESDGYPILLSLESDPQLEAQGITPAVAAIDINSDNVTIKNDTINTGEDT